MLIDPFTVIAQIVNFAILAIVLKYVLYDRVIAAMDRREESIAERLDARDAEGVRVFAEWHGRFYDLVRRGDTSEEEIRGLDVGEHGMESYSGFQIFITD